jgi:GNAT superfamily N-acetyltransferase
MEIRRLPPESLRLISDIDRSEEVRVGYTVEDGALISHRVHWLVPNWSPSGLDEHSVQHQIETWRPVLGRGGMLLGAFDGETLAGLAIIEPVFEPGTAWLAFMHVGRPHRRRGAATALWTEAERIAAAAGANTIYVSATPSESAVGFYLSKGCVLASTPHPELHAREPEDIHLTRSL